jgi:hypothetical protein
MYWYEKCQTTYGSMKVCNYRLDHYNGHRIPDIKQDYRNSCNINLKDSRAGRKMTLYQPIYKLKRDTQ